MDALLSSSCVFVRASVQSILCITLDQCCPNTHEVVSSESFSNKLILKAVFCPKLTTTSLSGSSQNSLEPNRVGSVSIWRFYLGLGSTYAMVQHLVGKPLSFSSEILPWNASVLFLKRRNTIGHSYFPSKYWQSLFKNLRSYPKFPPFHHHQYAFAVSILEGVFLSPNIIYFVLSFSF